MPERWKTGFPIPPRKQNLVLLVLAQWRYHQRRDHQGSGVHGEGRDQAGYDRDSKLTAETTKAGSCTLNEKSFNTLWMPPFELDVTDAVKPGKSKLKILVTSTSKGQPKLGKDVQLQSVVRKTIDQ